MPYSTIADLPSGVKDNLPNHAAEIYMAAHNAAMKQYDNDEGKSAAVAWAAVEQSYKKNADGKWVAKEAKVKEADMSAEDTRRLLQGALDQQSPSRQIFPTQGGCWIRDVYDSELVYEQDSQQYKVSYAITDDKVTFGKPVKVMVTTVYNSIESLRAKYADIIQEAGKRNKAEDAKVKAFITGCTALLSDDSPQDAKIGASVKEADEILTWLKEQASFKTEDGVQFPADAYAYCPDKEKPSEWKLRIWEDPEKKVTRVQLGRAAAALSPGGFRGQKAEIPRDDLASVKRKIRAEYRKLDVEDEDIPRWVKESETRFLFGNFTPLAEAQVGAKGIARVVIIKPGWGNTVDNHYYSEEMLRQNYKVFEGVKMYADHQTISEEKERPEGSIKEWVASLKNVQYQEGVGVVGDAIIIEPWMQAKLANLRDKELLGEMGISIRAAGVGVKGKVDGREGNIVEKITRVRSVDFVTEAGAGGIVQMYESGSSDYDVDVVSLETLKGRRPDLVKSIENEAKATIMQEVKRMSEQEDKVKVLEGQVVTLTTERDDARGKLTEAEKAQRKAEAKSKLDEAIGKSELPDAAKLRIQERFKDAESAKGIAEAIKAEVDYIAALKEAGKVKGMGGSQPDPEKGKEALKESFKRMHPDWTESQLKVAVEGR